MLNSQWFDTPRDPGAGCVCLPRPRRLFVPTCHASTSQIQRKRDAVRARLSPEELAALERKESGGGGWWGSVWGSATSKKEEGDLALQDLTASFGGDAGEDKVGEARCALANAAKTEHA